MADGVKRAYRSPAREESAAARRAAIRDAATDLFVQQGFAAATLKAVARRAGVGERTVYDAFESKARLFEHAVGVAITGDEEPVPVSERDEFRTALAQADGRRAVELYATYSAEILERAAPLITVAIESAAADPALRAFCDTGAAATRENTRAFVDSLAEHDQLDGDPTALAMAAYALLAPLVHQHLRRDLGWPAPRYREWLESSMARLLLPG